MEYFVIGPDGKKYGPANIDTLNQWAKEGRLLPTTELESVSMGTRVVASSVPGIVFAAPSTTPPAAPAPGPTPQSPYGPQAGPYGAPQPGAWNQPPNSPYPRAAYGAGEDGKSDVTLAWVFGVLGLCLCPIVFSSLGIWLGKRGKDKGHPGGQAAMIFCIITLVLGIVLGVILNVGQLLMR